ncbi:MAG: primosomal protein N', partial [Desulfobacterales bacterium]
MQSPVPRLIQMTAENSYIEVAVAIPVYHTFTYSVPQFLLPFVAAGKRVLVPFGQRTVTGYILGPSQDSKTAEIKHVLDILDEHPLFESAMISFFQWISDYYKHPIGEVIKNALPGGLTLYDYALLTITPQGKQALKSDAINPLEKAVLKLLDSGPCRLNHLSRRLKQVVPAALVQSLQRGGYILKTRELRDASIKTRQERFFALADPVPALDRLSKPRKRIIDILGNQGEISMSELKNHVPTAARLVRALEKEGYLKVRYKRVYRDPFGEPICADIPPTLNAEQQRVVLQIVDSLNKGFSTFLLQGVTGSGKTEVYMQVAAETLKQGKPVLVLVPEIALITQMERRFRSRFGERIAVLHSGLSAGERYDQWSRILQQKADIVIGARSAVFAPFSKVGLTIVDEEHDSAYKQENNLRYNARDLAVVRAKLNDCIALLGSATPSIQSCYNAYAKKFVQLNLQHRIESRPLP